MVTVMAGSFFGLICSRDVCQMYLILPKCYSSLKHMMATLDQSVVAIFDANQRQSCNTFK